jgi:hypothetical protein
MRLTCRNLNNLNKQGEMKMLKRNFCIVLTASLLLLCVTSPTQARTFEPSLNPAFVQQTLKTAGIYSEIIDSDPVAGYPYSVYIPNLKGSTVTISFPKAGLRSGIPFLLEIDGMTATVRCSDDGKLEFLGGDKRIVNSGVFDIIGCILNNILESVVDLIESIAKLNIAGILEAVFGLVSGIITCAF